MLHAGLAPEFLPEEVPQEGFDPALAGVPIGLNEPRFDDAKSYEEATFIGPRATGLTHNERRRLAFDRQFARDVRRNDEYREATITRGLRGETFNYGDQPQDHVTTFPSGHKFFEISDDDRHFTMPDPSGRTTLGDMLGADDELLKYYPWLAKMKVKPYWGKDDDMTVGYYDPGKMAGFGEKIAIDMNALGAKEGEPFNSVTHPAFREVMLHEIQHAIQNYEGMLSAKTNKTGRQLFELAHQLASMRDHYGDFHPKTDMTDRALQETVDALYQMYLDSEHEMQSRMVEGRMDIPQDELRHNSLLAGGYKDPVHPLDIIAKNEDPARVNVGSRLEGTQPKDVYNMQQRFLDYIKQHPEKFGF